MSHEVAEAAADAGMHAERSALIQAAQRGGVTLWYSQEDEVYIAVFPSEPTIRGIGDTPALALVELLIATRAALESARDPDEVWEVRVQIDQKVFTRGSVPEMVRQAFHEGYARALDDAAYRTNAETEQPQMEYIPDEATEIARLRADLDATRADLDTLRNGVAWLGSELDRVKAWAGRWKRAAKRSARDWRDLVAAYEDMRAENTTVRRVARLLVAAWRGEKGRAAGREGPGGSVAHVGGGRAGTRRPSERGGDERK